MLYWDFFLFSLLGGGAIGRRADWERSQPLPLRSRPLRAALCPQGPRHPSLGQVRGGIFDSES